MDVRVDDIIASWSVPMLATLITQSIVNMVTTETETEIVFNGVPLQPLPLDLNLQTTGGRNANRFRLWCNYCFELNDIIEMDGMRLRVVSCDNWNRQGYHGNFNYVLEEQWSNQ